MRDSVFADLALGRLTRIWNYLDGIEVVSDILASDGELYSSWLVLQIKHFSSFIQAGHHA